MGALDQTGVRSFLEALGGRQAEPVELLLLGGSGMVLLGFPRITLDIDYVGDDLAPNEFQKLISTVAAELHAYVDPVSIQRFVPLPPDTDTRRIFVGRFGVIDVFVIDPYVIALSKLDRGFDTDLDDVVFLLRQGLVQAELLELLLATTLDRAYEFDIDPVSTRRNFDAVRRRQGLE